MNLESTQNHRREWSVEDPRRIQEEIARQQKKNDTFSEKFKRPKLYEEIRLSGNLWFVFFAIYVAKITKAVEKLNFKRQYFSILSLYHACFESCIDIVKQYYELYLESIKFLFALLGNDSLSPLTCFYNFLFMNISTRAFQGPNPRKRGLRYKIKGKFGKKSLEGTQNQY